MSNQTTDLTKPPVSRRSKRVMNTKRTDLTRPVGRRGKRYEYAESRLN